MIAKTRLYLNADRTKVVAENSKDAAFLLAGAGGEIPVEYQKLVPGGGVAPVAPAPVAAAVNKAEDIESRKTRVVGTLKHK